MPNPTLRTLAKSLGLSRTTISDAFYKLVAEAFDGLDSNLLAQFNGFPSTVTIDAVDYSTFTYEGGAVIATLPDTLRVIETTEVIFDVVIVVFPSAPPGGPPPTGEDAQEYGSWATQSERIHVTRDVHYPRLVGVKLEAAVHEFEKTRRGNDVVFEHDDPIVFVEDMTDAGED